MTSGETALLDHLDLGPALTVALDAVSPPARMGLVDFARDAGFRDAGFRDAGKAAKAPEQERT